MIVDVLCVFFMLREGFMSAILLILVYFMPTFIGLVRYKLNIWAIIFSNIFLGWTVIGWVFALFLSVKKNKINHVDHVINALGKNNH